MGFTDKIKSMMLCADLTPAEMGKIMGTDSQTCRNALSRGFVKIKMLLRICSACGFEVCLRNKYGVEIVLDVTDIEEDEPTRKKRTVKKQ